MFHPPLDCILISFKIELLTHGLLWRCFAFLLLIFFNGNKESKVFSDSLSSCSMSLSMSLIRLFSNVVKTSLKALVIFRESECL